MEVLLLGLVAMCLFKKDPKKGKKARKSDSYREWEKRRREQYQYLNGDRP